MRGFACLLLLNSCAMIADLGPYGNAGGIASDAGQNTNDADPVSNDAGQATNDAGKVANDANATGCQNPIVGTGLIGTLGCTCQNEGAQACNGNNQQLALICTDGVWEANGDCGAGQRCDSTSGTCEPISSSCYTNNVAVEPDTILCAVGPTELVQCGSDLVSVSIIQSCPYACSNGACVGVCSPGTQQCLATSSSVCNDQGQWIDSNCPCGGCGGT
jgi:hypothetical protein